MKEINIKQINTKTSFREVCASYTIPRVEMPIKGGWGFTKEDAIIIDKNDPVASQGAAFDGVGLEYSMVSKRNDLEFTYLQKDTEAYRDVNWKPIQQKVLTDKERFYDKLTIKITALPYEDWKSRKMEWKENGYKPDFDKDWFMAKTLELTQFCYRDFWFDITSFYGQ